ncbi:co-chaperone GroES [Candidatus Berkelbacteria bacterium]|nr:co-chaperone GroES [Candidatus Berkelbacteria bacterium]
MTASVSGIVPLGDRVLVKLLPAEEMTKSGLIIPDTAKEKSQQAEVIAVGPGRTDKDGKRIVPEVKPGDHVLMPVYGGDEIKVEGEEYKIVSSDDLLAVMRK